MLRATTACNFSSLIWPAGSAPAALASLLFDPPEPQIIGKTQCFVTFLPFRAPVSSFFWDFLFCDLLSSSLLFSDSSHLCFSSVHIVGSLTSKLPSIIYIYIYILIDWLKLWYCLYFRMIIYAYETAGQSEDSTWLVHGLYHMGKHQTLFSCFSGGSKYHWAAKYQGSIVS